MYIESLPVYLNPKALFILNAGKTCMASEIFIPIVRRAEMERLLSVWESEAQPLALPRELHTSQER